MAAKFKVWKVLTGTHYQNGVTYSRGEKFVTDHDMRKFNTLPDLPKYQFIRDATEAETLQRAAESGFSGEGLAKTIVEETEEEETKSPQDTLEALTVSELRALATDESIELTGLTRKDDILAAIRDAREKAAEDDANA